MALPRTDNERALVSEVKRLQAWIEKLGNDAPRVRVTESETELKNLVQVAHFSRLYFAPFGRGRKYYEVLKRLDDALIPYKGVLDELIEARREVKAAIKSDKWPTEEKG
jgi:hypothetical protein